MENSAVPSDFSGQGLHHCPCSSPNPSQTSPKRKAEKDTKDAMAPPRLHTRAGRGPFAPESPHRSFWVGSISAARLITRRGKPGCTSYVACHTLCRDLRSGFPLPFYMHRSAGDHWPDVSGVLDRSSTRASSRASPRRLQMNPCSWPTAVRRPLSSLTGFKIALPGSSTPPRPRSHHCIEERTPSWPMTRSLAPEI